MLETTLLCGEICRPSDACSGKTKCGLCPLSRFYAAVAHGMPDIQEVPVEAMPQLQRKLLAHERDMTSTLEAYHGSRTRLRVLRQSTIGRVHHREVLLTLPGAGRAVEFGAISIHLDLLSRPLQDEILRASRPLGGLLHEHGVRHVSRPKAFIRLVADSLVAGALGLEGPVTLYGRCNALFSAEERLLADIVEILPP